MVLYYYYAFTSFLYYYYGTMLLLLLARLYAYGTTLSCYTDITHTYKLYQYVLEGTII